MLDGTAGLDFLAGRVSILDFPNQRLCVLDPSRVPAELERQAEWSPAQLRNGKLFVTMEVGGKDLEGIFYDTGSSSFPLMVDHEQWKELTGRTGEEESNRRMVASSWGSR